jgi:hypothetical protein
MKIKLEFARGLENPDPPDRLSDEQIRRLAKGARRLLYRALAEEELAQRD